MTYVGVYYYRLKLLDVIEQAFVKATEQRIVFKVLL